MINWIKSLFKKPHLWRTYSDGGYKPKVAIYGDSISVQENMDWGVKPPYPWPRHTPEFNKGEPKVVMLESKPPEENPLDSITTLLCFSSRDLANNPDDAWLYGITVGWGECLDAICKCHKWTEQDKQRLIRLREKYKQLEAQC